MSTTTIPAQAAAEALGRQHGQETATWTFDGNTPPGTYRKCLDLDAEGDPAWDNFFGTTGPFAVPAEEWGPEDVLALLDSDDKALLPIYEQAYFAAYREAVIATARQMVGD